jgi:hypothetical protein
MEHFDPVIVDPYPFGVGSIAMWNMVYLKGRRAGAPQLAGGNCST